MRIKWTVVVLSIVAAGWMFRGWIPAVRAQAPEHKTIWYGVYTDEQAARGKALYTNNCSRCHGDDLSGKFGNPLEGKDFMEKWREDNVESLFLFMQQSMPPAKNRTTPREPLPDQIYIDIIGYVFQSNSFPTGSTELSRDTLAGIRIEGRDGPQPLPSGALARVEGCLVQRGNNWALIHGTDPVRTRTAGVTPQDEIEIAQREPLGRFTFTLANLGYVDDFDPTAHNGHKMLIKGTLVRQPGAERINITGATMLADSCD